MSGESFQSTDRDAVHSDAGAERLVDLFGVEIADTSLDDAAGWIVRRAQHRVTSSVAFLNAHCVNTLYRDRNYESALGSMDRIFADGSGMRLAARASGIRLRDNVNGTDLFPVLCRKAAAAGTGLYLLGAKPGIAAAAGQHMQAANPGLRISGTRDGYFEGEAAEARVIDDINTSGAEIVLVAMGVPAQEIWIARNRHRLAASVVIGVGGLFDYYSGRIPRAPLTLRRAGLEWAWRLAMEPRRLARRYLIGNIEFMARVAWHGLNRQPAA